MLSLPRGDSKRPSGYAKQVELTPAEKNMPTKESRTRKGAREKERGAGRKRTERGKEGKGKGRKDGRGKKGKK